MGPRVDWLVGQTVAQPGDDLVRREEVDARGGQFDGQRQTVEPPADGRDRRRVRVAQREVRSGRAGTLHEQLDRLVGGNVSGRRHAGLGGEVERWHVIDVLAGNRQRLATGGEDGEAWRRTKEAANVREQPR